MKRENFDLNRLYTFFIAVHPEDKTKYVFQDGQYSHEVSGLILANSERDALEKLYSQLEVEYGKTMCQPNVRHFVTEQIPYMSEDKFLCTGFTTTY